MDADATDPAAIGNATAALAGLTTALDRDLPQDIRSAPAIRRFSSSCTLVTIPNSLPC